MIKKLVVIIFATFAFLTPFISSANAQVSDKFYGTSNEYGGQEYISLFDSFVKVNKDNSIDVTEKIVYRTATGAQKHGIYRDIYPYSSEGRRMVLSNISVSGENGQSANSGVYAWQKLSSNSSRGGSNVRLKIGDPDSTFTGERVYIISYHASQAVAHPKNEKFDEIYWNATGNEWPMPIKTANITISLPQGVLATQTACYVGVFGANNNDNSCKSINGPSDFGTVLNEKIDNGLYSFDAENLGVGSGLTVAVGFPKGLIPEYTKSDDFWAFVQDFWQWIFAIIIPLASLIYFYRKWSLYGRDPKGRGVIVPQYDVPDKLTPLQVAGIVYEKIDQSKISAELIYLATKGYIKIKQIEGPKIFGLSTGPDYELTRLKSWYDYDDSAKADVGQSKQINSDLSDFQIKILNALFKNGFRDSVLLSSLKNSFYVHVPGIKHSVALSLKLRGYYKNLGNMEKRRVSVTFIPIMIVYFVIFSTAGGFLSILGNLVLPIVVGLVIGFIIHLIFSMFMASKTEMGVSTYEYLLGLKEYLQIAEKDRLAFHNAPEKKPEVFEKLLPFAMILGVEKSWAKEFEGIYMQPPGWYEGSMHGHAFSAIAFSNSLSDFGHYANSAMITAPQSSGGGSGGGGFSGGGGGGGGGGSW